MPIFQPSHMPNNRKEEKYISLLEAARIYGCTQKHMALMAREKKLRAIKLGRNWLTTIDWLKEYNKAVEENNKKRQIKKAPIKRVIFTPQLKSVFRKAIAASLISLLVFTFISTAYIAAKEGSLSLAPFEQIINKLNNLDFQSSNLASIRAFNFVRPLYEKYLASVFDNLKPIYQPVYSKVIKPIAVDISNTVRTVIRGYNKTKQDVFAFIDKLFTKSGNFVINFISNTSRGIVKGPSSFGKFVVNVFQDLPRSLKKFFTLEPFAFGFPTPDISEQSFITIKDLYKKLSKLRKELGEIERGEIIIPEPGDIIQHITVVKKIEGIDQETLDELKTSILAEVDAKISAIEITDFESMTFHHDSLWANIGSFSTALGTGGAFSAYGPVTLGGGSEEVVINATNWDVDDSGNITAGDISLATLTASGDITVSGNITGSGTLAISGQATFTGAPSGTTVSEGSVYINPSTASSSYTLFGIAVGGTEKLRLDAEGDLTIAGSLYGASTSFDAIDATTLSLDKIPTITSDPVLLMQPTNVSGSWATGSATFLGINASSSFSGNFADFRINNTSKFFIDEIGNLGVAGVGQFGGISTVSYSRFGIGTTSHGLSNSQDLLISGSLEVASDSWFGSNVSISQNLEVDGAIYGDLVGTITVTGFNQGSVIFAGPGGELSEDNVNFFWDDTSNRLGIGDTSPDAKFDVAGSGIFDNELIVGGALQVGGTTSLSYSRFGIGTSSHGLSETQDVMISGKLEVASDSWFGSNASVSGKFEVLGDITLGDADTDLLVVNADIASNLIPNDSTRYVGDTNSRWAYGYFDELNVTSMSAEGTDISGTRAETFTINSDNETNDTEDAWLTFERGPTFTNASLKWDSGNDRFDMNFPLIVSKSLDVTGTFRADYVGIGTAPGSPYLLNVAGDVYFQEETFLGTTSTYFDTSGNLEMGGGTISDATDEVDIDDSLAVRDYLQVGGTSATTFSRFGTADSDYGLSAANNLLISGNLEVDSSTWFDSFVSISSNFEIGSDKFKVSGSTGNTTIAGNLTLSGIFTADTAASHSFAGDLAVGDDLDVSGTLTINTLSGILKASSGTISGLANLDDINDVVITSVADNELLAYDSGGNWINQTASEAGLEPTVSWADLTIGGSPLTITGGTNAVAVATAITFNYDSTIFSIDGNDLTIASASFWELTYDWKVASESFYDEAYQQRGSQIAGTNLTWDGSELDWSATESDLETILGIDFGTNKTATNEYFLIGDGTDWESTASSSVLTLLELDNVLKADGSVDLTSDWTIANNNITLTAGTLTANHLAGTTASVSGKFEVLGDITLGDADTDLLVVNADIASNLIPNDGTRYVGDANNRWAYGYFDELNVTSMSAEGVAISGTTHETFTINSDAADDEDAWLAFERGSLTNASLKWDSANDKFDMNFPLTVQGYIYGQDELIIANQAQFGGTSTVSYSRFGIGNTGHGLSASNDLLISGDLEVDGRAWFDSTVSVSGNFEITGNTTIAGLTTLNGGLTTAAGQSLTLNGNLLAFPADTTYLQVSGNQLTFASDYQTGAGYDSRFVNVAGDTMTGALILNSVNELIVGGALQIGGLTSASYSRFGTTGATYTSAISTSDDLMISGDLEVDGQAWFDSTASVSGNFDVGGVISGDGSGLSNVHGDPAGNDGQLQYNDNGVMGGTASFYWNDSTNRVGIGDSTPETTFEVVGTASVSGAFYAADSTIQFGNFTNCNLDTNGSGNLVCGTDADTTYSAGGTLLNLTGTVFSVNEGTLTNGNICKYNSTGTKIECILTDSSINWDAAYDWKVASESFYDEAYNQRGSVIAGTNLTWDGSELDVDDPFTVTQLNFTNASGSGTFEMGSDKFKIVGSSGDTTIAGTLDPANVAAFTLTGQQTLGGTYYINNSGDAYFRYVGIGTAPGSTYRLDVSADSYLQGTTFLGETDTYFDTSGNLQMGGGTIADSSDEVDVDDSLAVNSYLQVGDNSATTYSRFGLTTDTSNHSLSGATSVLVAGNLEINGTLYTDGGIVGNGTFDCVDCIDWDDISDSMTLDANLTVASAGFNTTWNGNFYHMQGNVGIGTTAPSQALELGTNKWLSFEGTVDDAYETVIQVTNPTADRTVTLQNVTGTVYVSSGTDVTLADGGTNASLTASTGGIVYSGASALAILSGTATANKVLMSGASAAPVWSTPTYPNAATTGNILKADGTNIVLSTDLPTAVTIGGAYVYRVSGTDVAIADGGTGQSTALAGFNALSPLTTRGDLLTRDASNNARLGIGATGKYLRSDGTDPSWQTIAAGDLPGSFSGFANPTATIGLTVINGSATTAMRSDAAPPLSQAIIPTWTGTHTFSNGTYSALFTGGNVGIGTTTPNAKLTVYASSGTFFDVQDDGTSVFTVTDTQITNALPASFTAAGDVSIAYDLLFTNQTASYIKSNAPLYIEAGESFESNDLTLKTYNSGDIILQANSGNIWADGTNVGIGTTTPTALLEVNADVSNNTTSMQVFDSTGAQVLILEEGSSPDIWEQTLTYQFEQGSFYQTTIDEEEDHLLLAKNINGNYYSNGTFTSSIHNYSDLGGIGDFIKFRTNNELPSSTSITAQVQVSDDNFSTVKDSINLELTGDVQDFDISSLLDSKSVRVKLNFQTEDVSVTPQLVFFEVWVDVISSPPASLADESANGISLSEEEQALAAEQPNFASDNELISNNIFIDPETGWIAIGGTASISGDLYVNGILYASVDDLGFANDFIITEAEDEPALSFLNPEKEEIMRLNNQGTLKTKELCLEETCINEEDLKSFLGLKIASSSGTVEDNITITHSTDPLVFLEDLINGLEKLGVTIKNGVITAVRIVADKITAKEIFVEGNVEVQGDIETKGFLKQVVTIKKNEADAVNDTNDTNEYANDTNIAEETELERYVGRLPIAEDEVGFVSYSRQTVKPEISASGTGQLQDGEARINFDPRFVALLQTTIYKVIVTPTSETKMGLYVAEKTLDGFLVRGWPEENNVTFDWLVIASLGERANEEPIVEPSTETTASSSEPIVPAPEETVASESEPGSEQPTDIEGCTDDAAINYNLDATVDDGTCEYPLVEEITGCTDPEATNYNPDVTTDDASCEYPAPEPVCGDGECNSDETCDTCPMDCGECPPPEETASSSM